MTNQDNNPPQSQDTPDKKPSGSSPLAPEPSVTASPAPVKPAPSVSTQAASTASTPAASTASSQTPPEVSGRKTIRIDDELRKTLSVNTSLAQAKTATLICPKCGQVNRPGILVCEKCGTLLLGEEPAVGTKRFESGGDRERLTPDDERLRREVAETAELVNTAISTAGSSLFSDNMVLRLEIDGAPTPILVLPKAETTVGRRDPATGTQPDVDLSAYAGYRLGVSRTHAIIRLKNRQLEIYDLGSSNGTSINGVRLAAHQPHPLRDGDEILLGKMSVRVLFQSRNRRK